jgi:hypothetical protein
MNMGKRGGGDEREKMGGGLPRSKTCNPHTTPLKPHHCARAGATAGFSSQRTLFFHAASLAQMADSMNSGSCDSVVASAENLVHVCRVGEGGGGVRWHSASSSPPIVPGCTRFQRPITPQGAVGLAKINSPPPFNPLLAPLSPCSSWRRAWPTAWRGRSGEGGQGFSL